MIALRHTGTGEVHFLGSAEGYGPEWETLPPPPADADLVPYSFVGGAWVARPQPRWISKIDYVLLWPPAANAAVALSADLEMQRAWSLFISWNGPINLNDPLVLAGIGRAEQLGILTTAQADRIRAGLPPEAA
jgi:hypothetical protein